MNGPRTKQESGSLFAYLRRWFANGKTLRREQAAITAKAIHWRQERVALLARIEELEKPLSDGANDPNDIRNMR